jgi:hypothetical protein
MILRDCYTDLTSNYTNQDHLQNTISKFRMLNTWVVGIPTLRETEDLRKYKKKFEGFQTQTVSEEMIKLYREDKTAYAVELKSILQDLYNEIVKMIEQSGIAWPYVREPNVIKTGMMR